MSTMQQAIEQIVAAGRVAGTVVRNANVDRYREMGVRFLLNFWTDWVERSARKYLERLESPLSEEG